MVAHACNHSYLESGDQEDHSLRPEWQNVGETQSQPKSQVWWHFTVIPATWESRKTSPPEPSPWQTHKTESRK
jgi:hypothetical protein